MSQLLKAPFPWFGGKSKVAHLVWPRFGTIANYVEPFFGSGATLLGRPNWNPYMTETVNDIDSLLCNFFRAIKHDPEAVARFASDPQNETDLHARSFELLTLREDLSARLGGDPRWYDVEIAGWWVWGVCLWIGAGFASNVGPWASVDGLLVNTRQPGAGIKKQLLHLGNAGKGVWRCLPHLSSAGQGIHRPEEDVFAWFKRLRERFARVRVCCGDWKRVLGESVTTKHGVTGMFLDPPYDLEGRDERCYAHDGAVWNEVWPWALANGDNPLLRIALCGYEGTHSQDLKAAGWDEVAWKSHGGYGGGMGKRGDVNRDRERIWFSPHCLGSRDVAGQMDLLEGVL